MIQLVAILARNGVTRRTSGIALVRLMSRMDRRHQTEVHLRKVGVWIRPELGLVDCYPIEV